MSGPAKKIWKDLEVGSLWKKTSRKGLGFYTGTVKNNDGTDQKVIIFINNKKTHPREPDLIIYKDE